MTKQTNIPVPTIDRFGLAGRTALVTGSSRGIGKALAIGLAEAGADVIVNYAGQADAASKVVGVCRGLGVRSEAIQADLGAEDGARRLFEQSVATLGSLDIVVMNASVQYRRPWQEFVREEAESIWRINLRAAYEMMTLAIPPMQERGWGRFVTIGSVQQKTPSPLFPLYAASKAAQLSLVQNLAPQVAGDGVTVNNLAPGTFITDRNEQALSDPEYRQKILDLIPAGAFGDVEDCVGALLLLCSDAGRYMTGQDIYVDGGMGLGARLPKKKKREP